MTPPSPLDRLRAQLVLEEDFRALVYDDATGQPITRGSLVKGHPTIGYGRALDVNGVTIREADVLLSRDINETWAGLSLYYAWFPALDDVSKIVVTDMAITLGVQGVSKLGRFCAALRNGDREHAAVVMLQSKWAKDVKARRAGRLSQMLSSGHWPPDVVVSPEKGAIDVSSESL